MFYWRWWRHWRTVFVSRPAIGSILSVLIGFSTAIVVMIMRLLVFVFIFILVFAILRPLFVFVFSKSVDDLVALDDAQAIVVEIAKLHFLSPPSNTFLATLAADMDTGHPP